MNMPGETCYDTRTPQEGGTKMWSRRLWTAAAAVSATGGIGAVLFGIHLIDLGANPRSGTGSLGHVGAIIAGIILCFGALVLALLAFYFAGKRRD